MIQIFLFLPTDSFGAALGRGVCVFWGVCALGGGGRRERQREKEKERKEVASLKRSETICCIENMFAASESYIC